MTKGFENVVIFVNGDSISVVVKDDNLNTEKVAQIQNIISRELKSKVEITNDLLKKVADTTNLIKTNPRTLAKEEVYDILLECM